MSRVITTSPTLKKELVKKGCDERKVYVLPCCIDKTLEKEALATKMNKKKKGALRIIFIGRLDSYKRVDWLLDSVHRVCKSMGDSLGMEVNIIGEGPKRAALEKQAEMSWGVTKFWGQVNEEVKQMLLANSDLLVLPSDCCNEAFGIVQLEAMATGIPALAFDCENSGMGWVCDLPDLKWDKRPEGLADILQTLLKDDSLHSKICIQAKTRYIKLFSREQWKKYVERLAL
jgi:glycosyltransferase involved in cell wall biosynthesis